MRGSLPSVRPILEAPSISRSTVNKMRPELRRQRSLSEPVIVGGHQSNARLSKPPKVDSLHGRPRNRLQKRSASGLPELSTYPVRVGSAAQHTTLYVLEYEPYPYNALPSQFLGVYSTVDTVTSGAIEHGAYSFSREGLLDGCEYLSPSGRIKLQSQTVQRTGTEAAVSLRSHSLDERRVKQTGPVRSDIPHPDSQSNIQEVQHPGAQSMISLNNLSKMKETVFLGIRQGPTAANCLGVFASPSLAWGACLKNKASCALINTLSEESRAINAEGLPSVSGRLHGCGQHTWFVVAKEVDASARR